jgi:hypothetical protein
VCNRHFGGLTKPLLAAGGPLHRSKPQPGGRREAIAIAEQVRKLAELLISALCLLAPVCMKD